MDHDINCYLFEKTIDKLISLRDGKVRTSRLATLFVKKLEKPNDMYENMCSAINSEQRRTLSYLLNKSESVRATRKGFLAPAYIASVICSYVMDCVIQNPQSNILSVDLELRDLFLMKAKCLTWMIYKTK